MAGPAVRAGPGPCRRLERRKEAMPRSYEQHCSLALALDVVGDRWALLIVRDLLLGPRRFGELLEGLPGIGTDILTARLRDLEADGVVSRRIEGRASWYQLTDEGKALL